MEVKDNEVLRALTDSKKRINREADLNGVKCNLRSSPTNDFSPEDCREHLAVPISKSDQIVNLNNAALSPKTAGNSNSIKDMSLNYIKSNANVVAADQDIDSWLQMDEQVFEISAAMHELSNPHLKPKSNKDMTDQKSSILVPGETSGIGRKPLAQEPGNHIGLSGSRTSIKNHMCDAPAAAEDNHIKLFFDDVKQLEPTPQIRTEAPFSFQFAKPGMFYKFYLLLHNTCISLWESSSIN